MIEKKRIRNVNHYLIGISENEKFYVSIKIDDGIWNRLRSLGFSIPLVSGEQILPRAIGPVSRFNANGGFKKLKDLPMETIYRELCLKNYQGDYHYVEVPYRRYQREDIPAPSIELKIVNDSGNFYVVSPLLQKDDSNEEEIKHTINLFLEMFGYCELLKENLVPALTTIPTTRVNWHILPEGDYPWERLSQIAGELASNRPTKSKSQEHSINTILGYKPSGLVYGAGGFRGYLVFKFPSKNLFVMENVLYGNATYVFENEWEEFSMLTKADIIHNDLFKKRIEHRLRWEDEIRKLLS